ncbi:MAG: type II toxin-antitoxin system RelE/ParE family toxin [Pseudomonadota bacterium]
MAKISYSKRALADLERLSDCLAPAGRATQLEALDLISEAIDILARHPLMGRPAEAGLRELVISQGKTGYIALYVYEPVRDAVLVFSIRHQREARFPSRV